MSKEFPERMEATDAARLVGMDLEEFCTRRRQGTGPRYARFRDGTVLYEKEDLARWASGLGVPLGARAGGCNE